jgi:hypothetical protein
MIRIKTINGDGHRPIDKAQDYLQRYSCSQNNKEQLETIVTLLVEQFVVKQRITAFRYHHTMILYKDNIRMG